MPPVYKSVTSVSEYDGQTPLDLRSSGINLIYIPNFLDDTTATRFFQQVSTDQSCLGQHSYLGNFNRTITPKRLTYAYVPEPVSGKHYRFKGKTVFRRSDGAFTTIFQQLVTKLMSSTVLGFKIQPDTSIVNGYRYNGTDYISPHTDDEKFLMLNNTAWWSDSTVATITILRDFSIPMKYYAGNPLTGQGVSIQARHGSLLLQGSVLHEIRPVRQIGSEKELGRISITLRKFREQCSHPNPLNCQKSNCPQNLGPSNYLYYSNYDSIVTTPPVYSILPIPIILPKTTVPVSTTYLNDDIIDDDVIIDDVIINDEI